MHFSKFFPLLSLWLGATSNVVAAPSFEFKKGTLGPLSGHGSGSGSPDDTGLAKRESAGCGKHPSLKQRAAGMKKLQGMRKSHRNNQKMSEITLPVHMFIIATNETEEGGWIPDSRIDEQMQILNDDFANALITWELLNVTRIIHQEWFEGVNDNKLDAQMKKQLRVGEADVLNIYTVELSRKIFGYATLPEDYDDDPTGDGVVMNYRTFPGASLKSFNEGRTLTHEVGHWCGLYHTFSEEGDDEGCDGDGDFVDDTPPQLIATRGCVPQDSCADHPGQDPLTNFMDYSDDSCMQEFTPGQVERMRNELEAYREIEY
ncbi:hypothetical protein FA15DRAFT_706083 [Coprinopsis marcescibilis]|uniref:Peptidase M43 pregnancy-associated plasma-A domain-containing protein n=1 Tax=Coprinopsis marcescibilis TaxID=230819 RepID=A0A5C3KQW3_COPMA|nr:hypothetical protein FA15DRAFT_706083 [Coprinopsis marcescibilis]